LSERRRIAVLTTGRQDYGILRSTLFLLANHPAFELRLWVGGMHLKSRFGRPVELVRRDGLPISRELDFVAEPPDPSGDAARAILEVRAAIEVDRPEMLMLVGDRFETLAAGMAATIERVSIVHLHGGEETEGAIDNAFRHALTKLSHLHLVSHEDHAKRVLQMGEDPAHVVVVGAPGLDNRFRTDLPRREELEATLGIALAPAVVIVTVHPTTLATDESSEVSAVAAAIERIPATYVITQPNADPGGTAIRDFWSRWARGRNNVVITNALGERLYWGLLRHADAVLGNSSSGILEAPALGVPVVNVGDRQKGRARHGDVTDTPVIAGAIVGALEGALSRRKQSQSAGSQQLLPAGAAAPRIVEALAGWRPSLPVRKRFHQPNV
jgi:UDP-N-acetylglucosamine 2-epimerase (non-hydrolysing)